MLLLVVILILLLRDSITGKESDAKYVVIDLDQDDDIDAISAYKQKGFGNKFIATGHDGTKPAKSRVVNYRADLFKTTRILYRSIRSVDRYSFCQRCRTS